MQTPPSGKPETTFFDFQSLGTYAGASLAVVVVSNTIRKLTKWDSPWPPFIVSQLVAFGLAFQHGIHGLPDGLLAFLNGCLLFMTADGMQAVALTAKNPAGGTRAFGAKPVPWLSRWL